jgi:predicted cupin superfamily sugar epimerase
MRKANIPKQIVRIVLLCTVFAVGVLPALWVLAQEDARYFEETGHTVRGEFLRFYERYGGRAIFGYPLTRAFADNGRQVQYFQRARMELYSDAPEGQRVRIGLLGEELGYTQSPIPESEIPPPNHPDKAYFAETGHTVSFAFLEFYRNNGDAIIFGQPISEWIIEPNGRIVQYFQRNKMEWYPENPPGQRVQLGMLGTIYVEQFVDPIYKEREASPIPKRTPPATPIEPDFGTAVTTPVVNELSMMTTLKRPIIGLNSQQTVYVYVFDQDNHGVAGASVEIEVQYQDGRTDQFTLGATNQNGYNQLEFGIGSPSPGYVVIVKLNARYGDLVAQASTAFLPWW